ncbi:MAG: urease accessory protein UreF [Alphaproteobacteria bacterium]|nr:urease accessory protein UreF [Alphaproteobacteria bacterium]
MSMTEGLSAAGVYRLAVWLSPAFPVGAYTYSSGIEHAVESGFVADPASLFDWVAAMLRVGQGRVDADFFRDAYAAMHSGDADAIAEVTALADAMRGTAELALESAAQGDAFLAAARAAWPEPRLDEFAALIVALGRKPAYAVAVGATAATHGVPLREALTAFLHAVAANLVSAGLRLIPLGQTDGQRVTARLEPDVVAAAEAAMRRSPQDLGAATPMADWMSMQHETQYTRLFRS